MSSKEEKGIRHRHHDHHARGPKTFRRGRAIAFLEQIQLKRMTINRQLDKPEFETIKPILIGELKALDMVIDEFVKLFDLDENNELDTTENPSGAASETKGDQPDETNQ